MQKSAWPIGCGSQGNRAPEVRAVATGMPPAEDNGPGQPAAQRKMRKVGAYKTALNRQFLETISGRVWGLVLN